MKANHRNSFFGIASNGGHAMEKRLFGSFAAKHGAFYRRVVSIVCCVIMGFTCLVTACQPTPEREIVIGKGEGRLKEAIAATPPHMELRNPPRRIMTRSMQGSAHPSTGYMKG